MCLKMFLAFIDYLYGGQCFGLYHYYPTKSNKPLIVTNLPKTSFILLVYFFIFILVIVEEGGQKIYRLFIFTGAEATAIKLQCRVLKE